MKKYRLEYIEWIDAESTNCWWDEDEIDKMHHLGSIAQIGWLLKETKDYCIYAWAKTEEETTRFLSTRLIPKGWIKKRKVIKHYG